MIDIAWSEFIFVAILALILLGPEEIPSVLRFVGKCIGKARTLINALCQQIDAIADEESKPVKTPSSLPDNILE